MRLLVIGTVLLALGSPALAHPEGPGVSVDERIEVLEDRIARQEQHIEELAEWLNAMIAVMPEGDEVEGQRYAEIRNAKTSSLMSALQTVRSQCELYANQHNDDYPDLIGQGWWQLTGETMLNGQVPGEGAITYGPYLQRPPVNRFAESSEVCSTDAIDPEAGWAVDAETRMFYAIVSDEQADRSGLDVADAENPRGDVYVYPAVVKQRAHGMRGDLAVLRNAIDLYAAEHGGQYPSLDSLAAQVTRYTNLRGETSDIKRGDFIYGPYLRSVPSSGISHAFGFCDADEPDPRAGWAYHESTGTIMAIADETASHIETYKLMLGSDLLVIEQEDETQVGVETE